MTMSHHSGSAKIYQFPVGGRAAVGSHRNETTPAADIASLRVTKTVFDGSWYHQEAIQEAEQARKN